MGIGVNELSSDNLTSKVYSKYSNTAVNTNTTADSASSYLDFDGYLKLLTSQMSNQDFNNSMSDSEFIQQMASYSMMEAISQLTKQTALSYNSSLIGKAVTVSNGSGMPETGIVEAVTVSNGECKLLVNGNQYSADSITDVVDGEIFSKLRIFEGNTVEIKDGDNLITGKVVSVFVKNGNGYVTLENNDTYSMNAIANIVNDEESEEKDEAETDTEAGSAEVSEAAAAYAYRNTGDTKSVTYSNNGADELMKILDGEESGSSRLMSTYASANVRNVLEGTATVEEIGASSGLVSDNGTLPADVQSRIPSPSVYTQYIVGANNTNSNVASSEAKSTYDMGDETGVLTVKGSSAESRTLDDFVPVPGVTASSTRKFAEDYPIEAAFADSVGTNMADIRFIGNTDIMKEINTDTVICITPSGTKYTDIGWCGLGRLGEVVTREDGVQRVEIIGRDGNSSYLHTSGKYTLEEILTVGAPGSAIGKYTPSEIAIRSIAREYTAAEQKNLDNFLAQCISHASTLDLGTSF